MTSIHIELAGTDPPSGEVVLENGTNGSIRIWRFGNGWGDETLTFQLSHGAAREVHVTRRPQVYTRNVPSSVEVPAGGKQPLPFDLGDRTWDLRDAADLLRRSGVTLAAIYRVPPSPEAGTHGVWVGELRSPALPLD